MKMLTSIFSAFRTYTNQLLVLVTLLCSFQLQAQQVKVTSGFVQDSVVVGDQLSYYLTATYPKKLQLLFPDSTYNFQPFEFQKKSFVPTRTNDSISYDSAIYTLSTFEIDKVQRLQLPVFILHQQDCTQVLGLTDSVLLKELVTIPLPDTLQAPNLPLKANTKYAPVAWMLNYPILLIVVAALLVVSLLVWIIFGKRIRRHFAMKRLQKEHSRFMEVMNQHIEQLRQTFSSNKAEQSISTWKKYMEALEAKPFTKLTSRETAQLLNNAELGKHLHTVDAAIYGSNTHVLEPLENLREYAVKTFQQKLELVQHG